MEVYILCRQEFNTIKIGGGQKVPIMLKKPCGAVKLLVQFVFKFYNFFDFIFMQKLTEQKDRRKASEEAVGSVQRKTLTHKGGYLKYWNNDWKLADMMEQRNVDILCLQETKWKGSKPRNIGGGCKLFYNEADGKKWDRDSAEGGAG